MTEIGLGLTNVYEETSSRTRLAGCVGRPYGQTWVRIVDGNNDQDVLVESYRDEDKIHFEDREIIGELQV